jgi:eukaryotic-like serine/threonine-protein kinase
MTDVASRLASALAERYVLEREIGQGGMATVYLAQDLKHHRKVALKVLRPELAVTLGADRFFREIELAAQLQHPHILPLHDSGEAQGFLYYVMPYIDGESLRGRLSRRGELPIHDAVKILIEVSDALAYAHARGVVHRDIKPDNVLLSGRHALVTDFGVAKAVSEATGRQKITTAGVAMGTPAYMAPEQAAADPHIDHRVDIYAIGCLGYELLTGQPPFTGNWSQEILAAHVTQNPEPVAQRRPAVPPALAAVVMTCLAKRPADRWQSAEELLERLEEQVTPTGGVTPTETRPMPAVRNSSRIRTARIISAVASVIILAGIVGLYLYRWRPALPSLGKRSAVTLEAGLEMTPAISPDGKMVAYSRVTPEGSGLLVQQLAGGQPVKVVSLPAFTASMPAWSPDGTRLLYLTPRGLEVVPALGGVSRILTEQTGPFAGRAGGGLGGAIGWGSWAPDGERVVYTNGDALYVRGLVGDSSQLLVRVSEPHSPVWSPDGNWIAYVSGNLQYPPFANLAPSAIWIVSSTGGRPIRVTPDQPLHASPTWLPDSRGLLFVSDQDGGRDIYAIRLTSSATPAGSPVRLTTGLRPHTISLSADGERLVYSLHVETANVFSVQLVPGRSSSLRDIKPITTGSQVIEGLTISPDGRWLAFDSNRNGSQDIWRMPLDGSSPPEQLASSPEDEFQPDYSADGKRLGFHITRSGSIRDLYVMPATGGQREKVEVATQNNFAPHLSPDGQAMVYNCPLPSGGRICASRRLDNSGSKTASLFVLQNSANADWSPDGDWISYRSGDRVFRIRPTGQDAQAIGVLPPGFVAFYTRWSKDSRTVYASGIDQSGRILVYAVPFEGGSAREVLHSEGPTYQNYRFSFDVHGSTLYLSLAQPESDIWKAEVKLH